MGKTLRSYADWRLQESIQEHTFYVKKYKRMLMSLFEWKGLPDGISVRFLEDHLYKDGHVVFFKNHMGFFQVSQAVSMGLNCYEEPVQYKTFDVTGGGAIVKSSECVDIWNDKFREGSAAAVQFFAKRISNIEKTIDCNLQQLKHPTIVGCPEGQLESVKAFYAKLSNGDPFIPINDDFLNTTSWQSWNLGVQNHVPDLYQIKREIENECLTYFGINNVNISKKERLTSGETEQNDEQINLNLEAMLSCRKKACEEIKEKFGLDVTVEIKGKEEYCNESVYNNSLRPREE